MREIHCRRCGSEWEFPTGIEIPGRCPYYMELADSLAGLGMEEEAECLYRVSLDAGNENAYLYYHEPEEVEDSDILLEQAQDFYYGYGCEEDVEMAKLADEGRYAEVWSIWEEVIDKKIGEFMPYGMLGVGYYCGNIGIPVDRDKGFYWMERYYDDV